MNDKKPMINFFPVDERIWARLEEEKLLPQYIYSNNFDDEFKGVELEGGKIIVGNVPIKTTSTPTPLAQPQAAEEKSATSQLSCTVTSRCNAGFCSGDVTGSVNVKCDQKSLKELSSVEDVSTASIAPIRQSQSYTSANSKQSPKNLRDSSSDKEESSK